MDKRPAALVIVSVLTLLLPQGVVGQPTPEKDVWSLEEAYWRYVQANDLEHYRTLWRPDFVGWPATSLEPARKAHITDWIAAHTNQGETLKSYDLERSALQVTDNLATVAYRAHFLWIGKTGVGKPGTMRIIHTWVRDPGGTWQIISGMSAFTDDDRH